ncbi:MAG: 3-methyl-2-oxobutanoate hydroxymethyltransferase [Kiritimatiellaeota bacterium]|nr:3-methyl-2-oxobutanoate hydroxymethyltransferase [Kiritimatiellota bacterium]
MATSQQDKLTVRRLCALKKRGERIVALTAYDALLGRLADECGVHLILVGDSLGMTVLGYKSTIPVTLDQSLHHTAAVCRGVSRALVVGDMPFMTYQVSPEQALRNAARYLQEAGADAVKLEGGAGMAPTVRRLVQAGIPVLGHIGIMPQSVLVEGGYRIHGREPEEARALEEDALAVEAAGAFALVLEGLPTDLSARITQALTIPTIGIGAGPGCSGQIQVVHDILGLFEDFVPRHAKRYADLADDIRRAIGDYSDEVRSGAFPDKAHSFE